MIIDEIRTFNKNLDLNPIGTPYQITSSERRPFQRAGSVAVAFSTEAEANRAIRNRLYIAGISVRVEKLFSTARTTQCSKCQGFGHLDHYCKREPKCRLCGERHLTTQHSCNLCKAKGACVHLTPKCANCKEAHQANHKQCEAFLTLKNRPITTTTTSSNNTRINQETAL